jgi:hypothetical protein
MNRRRPLADRLLVDLETLGDILIQGSLGIGEDDPSSQSHGLRRVSAGRQRTQLGPLGHAQIKLRQNPTRHHSPRSHAGESLADPHQSVISRTSDSGH